MKKKLSKITATLIILFLFPITSFATGYCGDGYHDEQAGEECDDGNFINRDGCSSYCVLEDMTPPEIASVSIAEGAENVPTTTNQFTITFSEPVDSSTINFYNIQVKQHTDVFDIDLDIQDNGIDLIINVNQDLYGELEHSIVIKNVKDISGNQMPDIFVRNFITGVYIDHTPPNIVIYPKEGHYNFTQSVTLTPYIGEETWNTDFLDKDAVIYYTLDGSTPATSSPVYSTAISLSTNTTLKYFGIDKKGNRGAIESAVYSFSCAERLNATKVSPYPSCQIQECDYGFELKSNVCVMRMDADEDDYKVNAATAPLFGSDTPMTISTKPALYITPEHKGIIPRPIIFKDSTHGTILYFERDTEITFSDGRKFSGYIKPPRVLFSKDFPIYFGYTFKSIFKFESIEGDELFFDPPYQITIPYTERYESGEDTTVFDYTSESEMYHKYPSDKFIADDNDREVTIFSDKTDTFFVAQPGQSFNKAEFSDMIGHWAQYYAEMLYRLDVVTGRSKGIYSPDDILTRAEFTKIALKSIGEEIDLYEEIEYIPFHDVPLYAWYVPYVKKAKDLGLINGYPDGSFKPDQPINKAEAIKILMSAFDFDIMSAGTRTDAYRDILTDQWYFPAANFAIKNGLVDGKRLSNGVVLGYLFSPAESITRAEMAKIAIKTIEFNEELEN